MPATQVRLGSAVQEDMVKHLVETSGKLALLDKMLTKLKAAGHRVLIFSQVGCQHLMCQVLNIADDTHA